MDVVDAQPVVAAIALAIALFAGVGILRLWQAARPRRIEPGAATMDLRDESPAIVDLLTGGYEVAASASW